LTGRDIENVDAERHSGQVLGADRPVVQVEADPVDALDIDRDMP
jgi:hypothetical protein